MDQSQDEVLQHLTEEYREALILIRSAQEAQALRVLLELLYKPGLPHYGRGLVHFVLGGMELPKSFGYNLFYAKNHVLRAIEAFESELAEGNDQEKNRVIELLTHARAVAVEPFQRKSISWERLDDTYWKHSITGGTMNRAEILNRENGATEEHFSGQRQIALGPQQSSGVSNLSAALAYQEDHRAAFSETLEPASEQMGGFAPAPTNRGKKLNQEVEGRVCENCGDSKSSGPWGNTKQGGFICKACYQYQWAFKKPRDVSQMHGLRRGGRGGRRGSVRGGTDRGSQGGNGQE